MPCVTSSNAFACNLGPEPLLKPFDAVGHGLLFDALDVFFVAGIHFDEVTDVKNNAHEFQPRVGGCRLQGVGRRIAFDARLGVVFGFDMGQVTVQHALLVRMNCNWQSAVLQNSGALMTRRSIGICQTTRGS